MRRALSLGILIMGLLIGPGAAFAAADGSTYVRTLEGTGVLHAADVSAPGGALDADERGLTLNAPLLAGDRISLDAGSRAEIALADGNVVRLGSGSVVTLDGLAEGDEANEAATRLFLDRGELQWVTPERAVGSEDPRLDLVNATVYLSPGGTYRLESDGREVSRVIVREGSADVLMPGGTTRLRAGESLEIQAWGSPTRGTGRPASSDLEQWGQRLNDEVRWADLEGIDAHLQYGAARLSGQGGWVLIEGRRAWRPWRVASSWRPFLDGHWVYTPRGWTWVSSEPWGWTTSHYGSWDYVPGYGWAWFPGSTYAPAWVYWYWGSGSAGWCPSGYYSRYYGFGSAARFGVYGWAGGGGHGFNDWIFCSTRHLRSRNLRDHCRRGSDYFDRGVAPRGIITTDTRSVTRNLLDGDDAPVTALRHAVRRDKGFDIGELPDVSDFISRRRDLSGDVVKVLDAPAELPHPAVEPRPRGPGRGSTTGGGFPGSTGGAGTDEGPDGASLVTPPRRPRDGRPVASPREPWVATPAPPAGDTNGREPSSADRGSLQTPVRRVIDGTRTPRATSAPAAPQDPVSTPQPPANDRRGSSAGSSGSSGGGSQGSGSSGSRGSSNTGREKAPPDEPPSR